MVRLGILGALWLITNEKYYVIPDGGFLVVIYDRLSARV